MMIDPSMRKSNNPLMDNRITLLINPHVPTDSHRRKELSRARAVNNASPYVKRVIEAPQQRATFADLLAAAQSVAEDEIACIANNDILFDDESLKWCDQLQRGECYALSRWTVKFDKGQLWFILQADVSGV